MINQNKKLLLKFVLASFVISALAVTLGFFGTHMILSSQEKRIENHFIPEALRMIELIDRKTDMPIAEIVSEYNNFSKVPFKERGPGPRRPPMTVSVVTAANAKMTLPAKIGDYLAIKGKVSDFKMFKDQVYNYDNEHFLVFRFNPPGPPPQMGKDFSRDGKPGMIPADGRRDDRGRPLPMFMLPLILTFVIILFVITASALLVLYFLKRQAQKAGAVLRALKMGDLKARFPITKIDEASELMLEFNQMAEEIEKLVVDLRDIDNLRRKLLQELAHDLRTPVASMKSLLESLLYQGEKMSKELREENLQLSIKEVEYFHHLVEDLLFLSGVHDIKYRGKFATVDVCDIIQHEVQVLSETRKDIKINFVYDDFYFVRADQHLFQRLMKNALSNAVDNAQSMVSVKVVKEGDFKKEGDLKLTIEVTNDGNGLTAEDIETFGKKRATRRINENTEGKISVGLGAVIMNKICEIHSAKLKIENLDENGKTGAKLSLVFEHVDI